MPKRHHFLYFTSLEEHPADEARELRERADELPSGFEREWLLRKLRQDETASHMMGWLTSPGLRPPT